VKLIISLACAIALCVASVVWAQEVAINDLRKQARELEQKRQELIAQQIDLLKNHLALLKRQSPDSKAVEATQAILDLKLSQQRVKMALAGAKIIADDGTYLGRIGPNYDSESIFCSYGEFGANYSPKSIWCSYGKYGASYNPLSPFCTYSTKPPKIIQDGTIVASLTVGWTGFPVSVSPHSLKAIFGDE
jgi:hypothetical protein